LSSPASDLYSESAKAMLTAVFLLVVFLGAYYSVPVEVTNATLGRETLLLCDFRVLSSEFVSNTTILRLQTPTGDVRLVITKDRFDPDLTGGTLRCKNAELLTLAPLRASGPVVVSGDIIHVLTTNGEPVKVLFADSIRAPQEYENWISRNRVLFDWIVVMTIWIGAALLFVSITRIMVRLAVQEESRD